MIYEYFIFLSDRDELAGEWYMGWMEGWISVRWAFKLVKKSP